jgi:hypothetical protein
LQGNGRIHVHCSRLDRVEISNMNQLVSSTLSLFVPRLLGTKRVERQIVTSLNGTERLRLLYRTEGLKDKLRYRHYTGGQPGNSRPGRGGGLDFDSMVWETRRGGRWTVISRFPVHRTDANSRCWICDIHRFEPDSGLAIIRIGTNQSDYSLAPPYLREIERSEKRKVPGAFGSWCRYSWVSWDLRKGCVTNVLKVCSLPGEPFGV